MSTHTPAQKSFQINSPLAGSFVQTGDTSWTFRPEHSEPMHNLEGALSETLYIYAPCVEWALDHVTRPSCLSVGLGLGLCEMVGLAVLLSKNQTDFSFVSYEREACLRDWFSSWVLEKNDLLESVGPVYDRHLNLVASHYHVEESTLRQFIAEALKAGRLELRGELTENTMPATKYHALLFDAYSSSTSPGLWSESFLQKLFLQANEKACAVATYASTGSLKRSLRQASFELTEKPGFGKKRESTFAFRKNRVSI